MDHVNETPPTDEPDETVTTPADADKAPEASAASDADAGPEVPPAEQALTEQTERADALAQRLKRVEAEFVNESKRLRRQSQADKKYAIERVIVDLLPLVDSLHTAMKNLGEGEADDRMREGLDLIGKQLLEILERNGVTPIEADGQVFDPNRHEALFTQPRDDVEPQTVVDVLRPGFMLHERVVRAAEVAVSVAMPAPVEEPREPQADGATEEGDA